MIEDIAYIADRVFQVEKALENYRQYKTSIEDLETDLMYLKERIVKLEEMQRAIIEMPNVVWAKYHKTPHKCPICSGDPSYITSGTYKCHSCEGKGIVWG